MSRVRILTLAALCLVASHASAQFPINTQVPLPPTAIPQFAQPLADLTIHGGGIDTLLGNQALTLSMCEFEANVLPPGTLLAPGATGTTTVWGYIPGETCPSNVRDSYLGPVIVNERNGGSTDITFLNQLGDSSTTGVLAYKYSTDQTLHWADPLEGGANSCVMGHMGMPGMRSPSCDQNYVGPIAAVPHLHGGEVPPEIDGGPDAWITSDGRKGPGYYTSSPVTVPGKFGMTYNYPNTQEASPAWFHDHTLGATRLNVYAGLAGGYLVNDTTGLPANLPGVADVTPLIIQDRMFDTNGDLFFTAGINGGVLWALNPEHPHWNPEFVGDVIVVNGKAWPYHVVEPKRQRFLIINGSNARAYELWLVNAANGQNGPPLWVIGNDGGYLDRPVKVDPALGQKLVVLPGERYEILIDFGGARAGTRYILRNSAKIPYPNGGVVKGNTTGRVMAFDVGACAAPCVDATYNPALNAPLRTPMARLVNPATGTPVVPVTWIRRLTLNEVMSMAPVQAVNPINGVLTNYPGGPLEMMVNNTKWSGHSLRDMLPGYNDFVPYDAPNPTFDSSGMPNMIMTHFSELPVEGTTEIWEFINLTADAHPMHLHLVQFQVLNRQNFDLRRYTAAYDASFPGVPNDPMCRPGMYCPGFGPPFNYYRDEPLGVLGGNPDPGPFLRGRPILPRPQETGWKDTVMALPGQITRVAVRWAPTSVPANAPPALCEFPFDPSGGDEGWAYVWHCHIVDHEDNEMMRPDIVQPNPQGTPAALREFVKGVDY